MLEIGWYRPRCQLVPIHLSLKKSDLRLPVQAVDLPRRGGLSASCLTNITCKCLRGKRAG
jgi:hypothetical protein